ncbi:DUF1684 domain-containing protein [Modestobacter sp. I12A-02628]|uniref:DUF1684 domain-containing protein n=1 Tax=Goekera deserti TaxID=2497753 RepID=A0A7K3WL91_9ACTN|nr:DUF1684 domain-containing protein [Goekera deserti]MPQ98170.1 DUF1684 domain-containing protein [Goekera deserti]NDI48819.1 DUF1684 domain-containing protein [Goekera deserti]NEL56500.1 DUF1684 domain-containing protein [Goekera deserti]
MSLTLLDWRRRVAGLYAAARAATDPEAGWRTWRDGRDELFAGHPDSPLGEQARASFTGLPVAPYDPALRFDAVLDTALPPTRVELPTADDGVVVLRRSGRVALGALGTVDVWWLGGYGGGLFLPLRDGSAGRGTYGGGRYVLDTVKGADLGATTTRLVVDLNFAYHPSCTYDPRWSCPLAPEGNRTDAVVAAGEQLPPGGWY